MRQIFILICALSLASCISTEAEWEAFYREDCLARFDEIFPGQPVTEHEIAICLEFRRSGLIWGFDFDDDDNDRNSN
jgi:hypothetical protein